MGTLLPLTQFSQISLDCGSLEPTVITETRLPIVVDSLLHVMNISLPVKYVSRAVIAFDESSDCPICYKECNLIILNAKHSNWCQVVYQLAHEMCHLVISKEVTQNLRWLEESICELSSYYFLPRLSKHWRRKKLDCKGTKPYFHEFERYAKSDQLKATPFEFSAFATDVPPNELKELIADCEMRDKNAHIANCMLPIFTRFPDTWHAVPLLGELSPDQKLRDSLSEWLAVAPQESRIGLQAAVALFGTENISC